MNALAAALKDSALDYDLNQQAAIDAFQRVFLDLQKPGSLSVSNGQRLRSFWNGITGKEQLPELNPIPGLYLWGGVGRGKTHLFDHFFQALPFDHKKRYHYHHFMRMVHEEIKSLGKTTDPLTQVAKNLAASTRVLCLDEMHVNDIADAMLMGTLLDRLFRYGVTLVTTSNVHPDNLYKDGLQRELFLPSIELIKQHTQVLHLGGGEDYRMRALEHIENYYPCVGERGDECMDRHFNEHMGDSEDDDSRLTVNFRDIAVVRKSDNIVWFDFDIICNSPRSTQDYIEIGQMFDIVLISDIPRMDDTSGDRVRRFINLVDEFYDRRINLVLSAEAEPEKLYAGKAMIFEFQRTVSRLVEMQSNEYLSGGTIRR